VLATLFIFAGNPLVNNAAMLGTGGATVGRTNLFSGYYNVANLAQLEKSGLGATFLNQFSMSEYSSAYVTGVYKQNTTAVGLTVSSQFNQIVRENRAQASYSKQINDQLYGGVSVNIHQLGVPNSAYQPNLFLTFNLGLTYYITQKFQVGFSTFNPNRTALQENFGERTRAQTRAGFALQLDKNLTWYTDFIVESEIPLNACSGLELRQKDFVFRGGFSTLNRQLSFGFGFEKQSVILDAGFMYHPVLGFSPALTLQYAF
jgi:hypothetical protein